MTSFKEKLSVKDKTLLSDVKNYLDITFEDDEYDKKLYGILCDGRKMLYDMCGNIQDYSKEGAERSLLFEYCRYGINKKLEYFKRNFKTELIGLVIDKEAEDHADTAGC